MADTFRELDGRADDALAQFEERQYRMELKEDGYAGQWFPEKLNIRCGRSLRRDIRLVFTGKGELEEEVGRAAAEDGRICYRGYLSYEEYIKQLQKADILVNPRNMTLPENQNNFPSKIMDYLTAGKVIVSTRFVGWEKFRENVLFCDCDALAIRVCMECAIDKLGEEASVFCANREKAKQFERSAQLKRVLEQI